MIFGLFGGDKKRVAEMIAAARSGDTEKIEQLLSKGADINAAEPESGDTPLLAAVDKSQWAVAELLLKHHPGLSLQDKNGNSALYLAVSQGDAALPMVNLLLEAGASPDLGPTEGDNAGATPLHIACATGANGCLESLLHHGASSTKQLPSGASPMHTATIKGDQKTIELLSNGGGDVNALGNEKRTPLHNCGITGNAKVAAALIRLGAEVDPKDNEACTPLMRAVMKDHAAVAKVLLDNGADPNITLHSGSTILFPLHVAAMHGQDEMISNLIDKGADVTAKVDGLPSLVDVAKHSGHESTAKLLALALKRHRAAAKKAQGPTKEIEALWRQIVQNIGKQDHCALRKLMGTKHFSALTPDSQLLVACVLGDTEQAKAMLVAGANPNQKFADLLNGITPLFATVGFAHSVGVTRLLMEHGADPSQHWDEGSTLLMETTTDQHLELAQLLLDKGANVNARMTDGRSALILAARNGGAKCVDLFLDAGADINATDNERQLGAFGWALNRLDLKLAEHLFNRGAEPNFGSVETLPLAIAEHASLEFVKALVARGCELIRQDQRGRMAFISARNPDPEVFDYFLHQGADPSEGNDFGYTPLILAALNNRATLIHRYLERGDDASVHDIDGETALSLAIEKDHVAALAALREFHVEERQYSGLTPEQTMLRAAADGALGTILNLRDDGVSINSEDDEGNSPLLLAVKAGHLGVVRSLYHLGADINHRNHGGASALGIAKASDLTNTVNSLQEFGASDALEGSVGKAFAALGGVSVINAGDVMFGRMSHPYKDKPPYDNPESDSEEGSDEDADNADSDDGVTDPSADEDTNDSVESKLDLLGQVLDSDQVKEQLPDAALEQLVQKLDHWRSMREESEFDDNELAELNRILGLFGLGEEVAEEIVRTPLFEAVHAQNLSAVKKIIKSGGDVNEVDGEGNTALLIAVLTRQARLVEELLKLGADPNLARPDGKGPLFGSVRVGEEKITQLLLKGGAKVDAPFSMEHNGTDIGSCTALYVAAFLGHVSSCRVLLNSGAQIDAATDLGYTPLMAAIDAGHEDVIDFLLKSGANVNPEVIARMDGVEGLGASSPLYSATRKENLAVIKKLLKRGADINRPSGNGWTPLKSAAQQGSLDIVKVLLEAGADPNIADGTNYTPLMNAVSGGHIDIVKLLLKFHADPNVQSGDVPDDPECEPGRTALMDAALGGFVVILRELIRSGANPNLVNGKGMTALHSAMLGGHPDIAALLIEAGANPNIVRGGDDQVVHGGTIVFMLATKGDSEVEAAQSWLKLGADPSYVSPTGLPLLQAAVRFGGTRFATALLDASADPFVRNSAGVQAYDLAVIYAHNKLVHLLIDRMNGLVQEIDRQNRDGQTALMRAVVAADEGAVCKLLVAGPDTSRRDIHGDSPLSYAVCHDMSNIVSELRKAGAERLADDVVENSTLRLVEAARKGALGTILDLLDEGVAVDTEDAKGNTALIRAEVHPGVLRALVKLGADISHCNMIGSTAYMVAAESNRVLVMKTLEQLGSPIALPKRESDIGADESLENESDNGERSSDDSASLVAASRLGDPRRVKELIEAGADVNCKSDDGMTALSAAIVGFGDRTMSRRHRRDTNQIIDCLLENGADFSVGKVSPFILAVALGQTHLLNRMLRLGANVNQVMEDGTSVLHISLTRDDQLPNVDDSCALALIDSGIDLTVQNESGEQAIHQAAEGGFLDALKKILDKRPLDVDARDNSDATPLIKAAAIGQTDAVRILLDFGADRSIQDSDGMTAANHAIKSGHSELAALLS